MTMPAELDSNQVNGSAAEKGVLCGQCDHVSPPGSRHCTACGSHLYVACRDCGKHSPRVLARCPHCGKRLHRTAWRRWRRSLLKKRGKINPLLVALVIAFAFVTYRIIVFLVEYRPVPPE
jgi:hypothetical protein